MTRVVTPIPDGWSRFRIRRAWYVRFRMTVYGHGQTYTCQHMVLPSELTQSRDGLLQQEIERHVREQIRHAVQKDLCYNPTFSLTHLNERISP